MKKNLFIARTPLQLFNCIEAKKRFHKDEENILLYLYQREIDKKQMQSLIESNEWFKIIEYPLSWQRRIFSYFYIKKIKKEYQNKIQNCYLGVFNSIINSLVNSIHAKELIVVDDGTKTLGLAKNIMTMNVNNRGSIFKALRNKILNTDRSFLYKASFFSIYTLEKFSLKNRIILNDYLIFKKSLSVLPKKNKVYFIGTNLNEKIVKSDKIFESYLEKVLNYYSDKELVYVLHRYENIEYIARLSEKYHFEYVKFDNILEVEIAKVGFIPTEFATFASSAIETLPLLYDGSKYKIFYIEADAILEHKQRPMKDLYDSFEKKGYDLISL